MNDTRLNKQYTAPVLAYSRIKVTITYPHHPFCGQSVEVLSTHTNAFSRLLVQLPDGTEATLPQSWTNYTEALRNDSSATDSQLLDIKGLFRMVEIINGIKSARLSLRNSK